MPGGIPPCISTPEVHELVLPLFSVNYNAERLETECSITAKYSCQKINLLAKIRVAIFTCAQLCHSSFEYISSYTHFGEYDNVRS